MELGRSASGPRFAVRRCVYRDALNSLDTFDANLLSDFVWGLVCGVVGPSVGRCC